MGVDAKQTALAGVPLGGLGAGCVEADSSGRFRNITINNNRTPETRIPESPYSFLALRVERPGELYCTLLQEAGEDDARVAPLPRLKKARLHYRALYPAAHYRLTDSRCPVNVLWTAFAPIIPFDHEASVLPAFVLSIRVSNTTGEAVKVATVLNWENLAGQDAMRRPGTPPPVQPVVVEDPEDVKNPVEPRAIGKRPPPDEPPPLEATPRFNALSFGAAGPATHNADAQYCLAAKYFEKARIDCVGWNPADAVERERLWADFQQRGHLGLFMPNGEVSTAGAVCVSFELAPGEQRRVDFTVAWYAPHYEVGGVQLGNAYTNRFANAMAVAQNALHYAAYYYASVSNWQHRLLESGLPTWINEMLIHHTSVLSTNTLYTKSGAFALLESPGHPAAGESVTSFYAGLPLLLLFPRFQETELALTGERIAGDPTGSVPLRLGMGNLQAPLAPAALDIAAGVRFVLAVCRNYTLTGNLVRVRELYSALVRVMDALTALDRDGDGLPEPLTGAQTSDGWTTAGLSSETAGLWCAAVRAAARLAASLQNDEHAARWDRLAQRASAAFEQRYWDDALGYYRLSPGHAPEGAAQAPPATACHAAQLAGQWYADLLGLGTLLDPAHVQRALASIARLNARPNGLVALALPDGTSEDAMPVNSWPSHTAAHFTCAQIARGQTDVALRILETQARHLQQAGQPTRCWPQQWDLAAGAPMPGSQPRHAGVLAVWHLLYAMQGFLMDLPNKRLRITPNLPSNTHSLHCVVMTPACLGWMRFQEDRAGGYRQRIHVEFDSPVQIDEIALRLPADVSQFNIVVEIAEGRIDVALNLQPGHAGQQLLVRPRRPMLATRAISVRITKPEAGAVAVGAGFKPA